MGTVIDNYGARLYAGEVKYIGARFRYRSSQQEKAKIRLKIKILSEDGQLVEGYHSPEGFSFETDVLTEPGEDSTCYICGFGTNRRNSYASGTYRYEVWHGNQKLYAKEMKILPGKAPLYESNQMRIDDVSFLNTDKSGNVLMTEESPLYAARMRYLSEQVTYQGLVGSEQKLPLLIRLFNPLGNLEVDKNSPVGFSYSTVFPVRQGLNKLMMRTGWGRADKSVFMKGTYIFELWQNGKKIYETTCRMK